MTEAVTPRRIVITGASSGIGAALAVAYAAPSVALFLTGRDEGRLLETARRCQALGAQVEYRIMDVRDADALNRWLVECDTQAPIDLVIANAGVSGGPRAGLESPDQVETIYAVNVQGVMNTILPLLPRMAARRGGQIAIVSSLAGFAPWPGAPAYCASKAAVTMHGLALRTALRPVGVRVNVVCPGFIDTPMTRVNPYTMPWLMEADPAARVIQKGLQADRAIIAFPWTAAFLARLIGALPYAIQARLLQRMPEKPPISG